TKPLRISFYPGTTLDVLVNGSYEVSPMDQYILGKKYQHGNGVNQNLFRAAVCYLKAANQGLSVAQYQLGLMYFNGDGIPQNYTKAMKWLITAANQGDAKAQYQVGKMHVDSLGVQQDYKEAFEWYLKAAEQGNADAEDSLGDMYRLGYGVQQDYKEAFEWYLKAAKQGNADAEDSLGDMYRLGYGVQQDYKEAFEWYLKAAEQGNADAEDSLGDMYRLGYGVQRDSIKAFEWYSKAANQGNIYAKYALSIPGSMNKQGFVVPQNNHEASEWNIESAIQRDQNIDDNLLQTRDITFGSQEMGHQALKRGYGNDLGHVGFKYSFGTRRNFEEELSTRVPEHVIEHHGLNGFQSHNTTTQIQDTPSMTIETISAAQNALDFSLDYELKLPPVYW
ncbi:hypothetical protein BGZ46_005170, partial [Entomortierella lignicola]